MLLRARKQLRVRTSSSANDELACLVAAKDANQRINLCNVRKMPIYWGGGKVAYPEPGLRLHVHQIAKYGDENNIYEAGLYCFYWHIDNDILLFKKIGDDEWVFLEKVSIDVQYHMVKHFEKDNRFPEDARHIQEDIFYCEI